MLEIKKQIAFHIKNNSIDVIELCKTLYPTPCYKIFSALFEINVNNNSFLLNQSEIILKSLPAYIQDSAKTSLLLNEISIQQTSNNMSNYLHAIDLQDNLIKNADIVMFGDSITEQGLWNEMIPNYKVANLGISGDTTNGMLKRIDTSININPTTIFIIVNTA